MKSSGRFLRAFGALAVIALAIGLGGCNVDGVSDIPARALAPLSPDLVAEMQRKNMPTNSPILIRIFKEEAELEVWKKDRTGQFALLKTYPICRWSGELGPKIKEGDRQAPEGFYQITPGQMNPHSNYYLAFNLGFPNAYDRANDRTGNFIMVHGDCSSRGCYAMTDSQIGEIFALGRDAFDGGQKSFQVQAYPFRMTALNMARHRNSPNMSFWRMIKEGYDHFEVTRQEPKVDVCDRHYVFDAEAPGGGVPAFNPRARCPAYQTRQDIAAAVQQRHDDDERQFADLVARGTETVAIHTGVDGGMNARFAARFQQPGLMTAMFAEKQDKVVGAQPGPLPDYVNPPRTSDGTVVASPTAPGDGSLKLPTLFASSVSGDQVRAASEAVQQPAAASPQTARAAQPKPAPVHVAKNEPPAHAAPSKTMGLRGAQPAVPATVAKAAPAPQAPASQRVAEAQAQGSSAPPPPASPAPPAPALAGAIAPMQSDSFDNRWSAFH